MFSLLAAVLTLSSSHAALEQRAFEQALDRFQHAFSELAVANGEKLFVFGLWREDWINANAKRWDKDFIITIYGGIPKAREIDEDALALVFCHELGHGYGGEPYTDQYNHIAVEGQADYWATSECLSRLLETDVEWRATQAALNVTTMLAREHREAAPRVDTPDPTRVGRTNRSFLSYQCRLDTLLAGLHKQPRPACWFNASSPKRLRSPKHRTLAKPRHHRQ